MEKLVSILIYTYNHEQYIEKAVLSVLSQKTNFEYHLHIIDDSSTDSTRVILQKLKESSPNKITLHLKSENSGQFSGAEMGLKQISSKYIAVLEGDDYWCYDYKLQEQVNILERLDEYSACFHDLRIQTEEDIKQSIYIEKSKQFYKTYSQINKYTKEVYPEQIISRTIIPLSSVVFRSSKIKEAFSEVIKHKSDYKFSFGWVFTLYMIKGSKFYYFNEEWAVYRNHSKGVTKYIDNDEFVKPVIHYLKKILADEYYRNLKSYIYDSLAEYTIHYISNSKKLSTFKKKIISIKIIYYRLLQGLYKMIEINKTK